MGVEQVLAGVAGALHGGVENYTAQKKYQQDERAIDQRKELAEMRAQVQTMLAQLQSGDKRYVHDTPSGDTVLKEDGTNARYDRPSGNVIANNAAASDRLTKNIDFGYDKLFTEEAGRNSRWATPSGNATLGAETTRRGQDVGAATARRGQDIGATTAQRGQDVTFSLGNARDATTRRGQDNSLSLGTERNKILKKKGSMYDSLFQPDGAALADPPEDVNLPVEAAAPVPTAPISPLPVVPRANVPKPGGGALPVTPRASAAAPPARIDVADADIDALATQVLTSQGLPTTPENVKTFRDRNRDRLIAQIKKVRGGGGQ